MKTRVVSVVGGGWSFRMVDHAKVPGFIIGINDAGTRLRKRPNVIVSMDRLWTENRWDQLRDLHIRTYLRRSAVQNIRGVHLAKWVRLFDCDHKSVDFTEDPTVLNGTNSGTCGLALAYILRPVELYLFGFDMCRAPNGEPYWYPPYAWASEKGGTSNGKYDTWAAEFNRIAIKFAEINCRVFNVSTASKIMCWPKISPQELGVAA